MSHHKNTTIRRAKRPVRQVRTDAEIEAAVVRDIERGSPLGLDGLVGNLGTSRGRVRPVLDRLMPDWKEKAKRRSHFCKVAGSGGGK